ncbi:MAG TPA: DUF4277 domain-containing protein [Oculatellaceae cyanobacterium]
MQKAEIVSLEIDNSNVENPWLICAWEGIKAEDLNDDKLGRTMDKLYRVGLSELFLLIALDTIKRYQITTKYSHLDSTSLHLHGEYQADHPRKVTFRSKLGTFAVLCESKGVKSSKELLLDETAKPGLYLLPVD